MVDDLADQDDRSAGERNHRTTPRPPRRSKPCMMPAADLPVLTSEQLAPAWQGETPVLCVAGRGPLDEAVALMLAQLLRSMACARGSKARMPWRPSTSFAWRRRAW